MNPMPRPRNRRTLILAVACAVAACAATTSYSDSRLLDGQEVQAPDIVIISNPKGCFVEPAHALVDEGAPIRFINATRGRLTLMFPTGETLFGDGERIFDLEAGQDSLTANVVADVGTQHDYAIFCFEINTLAEGRSHPTLIVK